MQIVHLLQDWWQHQTWLEIIGVITGLACVYLAAKNNIWNWPIAIISTAIYVYIYQQAALYADMLQYVYLCITSMYGWYNWNRGPGVEDKTPVRTITSKQLMISVLLILIVTPLLGFTLITFTKKLHYNPPAYPYLDSFCTACSFVAQFFLTRKVLENWLIWVFVDIIYTVIYFKKDLQITAFMFFILIIIAVFGYIDWRKAYKMQASSRTP
jgi:nicotinamide mononucleotide transporter